MPKAAVFRANSVIYFQGDIEEKIYVLQKGKVQLSYLDMETGKKINEIIQTGEFFGVKSALGHYPREENAVVLEDAAVLVFTVPEFEQFASQNTRIILKMLKVFSNQLRRVHRQVENLLQNPSMGNAENGLFRVGEYYLKNKMYSQARYVFSRYLTYYPSGKLVEQASRYLEAAEQTLSRYGDGKGPALFANIDQPLQSEKPDADTAQTMLTASPVSGSDTAENSAAAKKYYDAISLLNQGKAKEALAAFKALADQNEDLDFKQKALFDMGRCLLALAQWEAVIKHYTGLVQSMPRHPSMPDILLYMGQAYEKKGEKDRAIGFYKKVLTMDTDEDSPIHIKAIKALKASGGA